MWIGLSMVRATLRVHRTAPRLGRVVRDATRVPNQRLSGAVAVQPPVAPSPPVSRGAVDSRNMQDRTNIRAGSLRERKQSRKPMQLLLRITMAEITPSIWRLIRVPDQFTLHQLHRILQIVFSHLDYHLYEFQVRSRRFEAPDPESEAEDATRIRLCDLTLSPGSQLTYIYDFGDGWEHNIAVEAMLPMPLENGPDWSPRLLDGERAAPPEDAGGPHGFMEVMAALKDRSHPRHKEIRNWVGNAYDPGKFDTWAVDHALTLAVAWGAV
jgi:hypothetical protein